MPIRTSRSTRAGWRRASDIAIIPPIERADDVGLCNSEPVERVAPHRRRDRRSSTAPASPEHRRDRAGRSPRNGCDRRTRPPADPTSPSSSRATRATPRRRSSGGWPSCGRGGPRGGRGCGAPTRPPSRPSGATWFSAGHSACHAPAARSSSWLPAAWTQRGHQPRRLHRRRPGADGGDRVVLVGHRRRGARAVGRFGQLADVALGEQRSRRGRPCRPPWRPPPTGRR